MLCEGGPRGASQPGVGAGVGCGQAATKLRPLYPITEAIGPFSGGHPSATQAGMNEQSCVGSSIEE